MNAKNESSNAGQTPVIEMRDVAVASAIAPELTVIEDINWTVAPAEFWVVGGLPGSGKSDFLATTAGLLRPQRGSVRVFGRELAELAEDELVRERLRIGVVFANEGHLFSHLTVEENLALPICYHRNCRMAETTDRVHEILQATELTSLSRQVPGTISRNLRGRVGLARALSLDPELLLLDNPLRGLDPRQIRWWLDFLDRLAQGHELTRGKKITLVVTTDGFRSWASRGHKFALINHGRWLFLGGRAELEGHDEPLLQELLAE